MVSYTEPHTKTLYYKRGFFNNISFLFFRIIDLAITLVISILLFVVLIVVTKKKLDGSWIAKPDSYKGIIQIDIPIQGCSSRGT